MLRTVELVEYTVKVFSMKMKTISTCFKKTKRKISLELLLELFEMMKLVA
jgi:hypothetical protein